MRSLSRILIVVLFAISVQCKKEEKEPENPPFDSNVASESLVNINTQEIGGANLTLVTFFDEKSPLSGSSFNTVVSKKGEQLLFITDGNEEIRALTLSTPVSALPDIMKVDARSTAISLVFMSPGILTTTASEANAVISKIQGLGSFSAFNSYLKGKLQSSSLNKLLIDTMYTYLLSNCVEEYCERNLTKGGSSEYDISEYKNYFNINLKSSTELELSNHALRYVNVAQRDFNTSNNEVAVKRIAEQMGGRVTLSWGSLFTSTTNDPAKKTVQYSISGDIAYSDIWVVGPGFKAVSEVPPQSIKSIEQPILETVVAYVVFPLVDLISGSCALTTAAQDYTKIKKICDAIKISKNIVWSADAIAQKNQKAIARELSNLTITIFLTAAKNLVPGIGQVAAIPGIIMGSANLTGFVWEIFKLEPYAKYKIVSGTGPSTIPVPELPENNSLNNTIPVSFKWNSTGATNFSLQVSRYPDFSTKVVDETGLTVNTKSVSTLSNGVKYYWRVKSSNQRGSSVWSDTWNFTTSVAIPVVTTTAASSITYNSAIVGGDVTSDGGASVSERGVYYSEFSNPETTGTKVTSGTGSGPFTKTITGLAPSKRYYVKAYAVNIKGKAYGDVITFTTPEAPNLGKISGIIRDARTSSAIASVTISVYLASTLVTTASSLTDGSYNINIAANSGYRIVFGKTGYLDTEYQNVIVTTNNTVILEPVLQINTAYAGNGTISGTIKNALTGNGISGVTLKLRKGMNVTTGTILATVTTSTTGAYTFSSIPGGNYSVEASLTGYNTTIFNVVSLGGITSANQDATLSPVLASGDTRIVLTWGSTPADLDSHLTGPKSDGSRFHIYYGFKTIASVANLDLDDVSGFGPETTTIITQINGVYRFSVHDFSNRSSTTSNALSNSGAQVKVYKSSGLVATFNVPPSTGGTLWTVFELNGSTITPVNQMSYSATVSSKGSYTNPELYLFINLPEK